MLKIILSCISTLSLLTSYNFKQVKKANTFYYKNDFIITNFCMLYVDNNNFVTNTEFTYNISFKVQIRNKNYKNLKFYIINGSDNITLLNDDEFNNYTYDIDKEVKIRNKPKGFKFSFTLDDEKYHDLYSTDYSRKIWFFGIDVDEFLKKKQYVFETNLPVISNSRFTNLVQIYDTSLMDYYDFYNFYYSKIPFKNYKIKYTDNDSNYKRYGDNADLKYHCHLKNEPTLTISIDNTDYVGPYYSYRFPGFDSYYRSDFGCAYHFELRYIDGVYQPVNDLDSKFIVKLMKGENPTYTYRFYKEKQLLEALSNGYVPADAIYYTDNTSWYKYLKQFKLGVNISFDNFGFTVFNDDVNLSIEPYYKHLKEYSLDVEINNNEKQEPCEIIYF